MAHLVYSILNCNHSPFLPCPFIPLLVFKIIVLQTFAMALRDAELSYHIWFLKLLYEGCCALPYYCQSFIPYLVFKIIVQSLPMPLISFELFCPVREPLFVERASGHREKEVIQYSLCIQGIAIPRTPRFLMIPRGPHASLKYPANLVGKLVGYLRYRLFEIHISSSCLHSKIGAVGHSINFYLLSSYNRCACSLLCV